MKSDEECMQAMMCSYEKYAALREMIGLPLKKSLSFDNLPAWVLRPGQQPKTDWIMPTRNDKPAVAKSVATQPKQQSQPATAAGPITVAEKKPESWAARVRAVIVAAKARGENQQQVLKHAVEVLGMKDSSARNCIKFNWDRV